MLDVKNLAAKYAAMQHNAVQRADDAALCRHITNTLQRCLPANIITEKMIEDCFHTVYIQPDTADPMHTGAIHTFAGQYLLESATSTDPLLQRLHASAVHLLPTERTVYRDDLRLVVLDALYKPELLPPGMHLAFLKYRLGLNGHPRLSCEEISIRMRKPLTYIHELESAILAILSSHHNGGSHA